MRAALLERSKWRGTARSIGPFGSTRSMGDRYHPANGAGTIESPRYPRTEENVKKHLRLFALVVALAMVLAACGDDGSADTTAAPTAEVEPIRACQVTDTGGIDDRSFNQTAWQGVLDAQEAGFATEDSDYLESTAATDYETNINSWIQ